MHFSVAPEIPSEKPRTVPRFFVPNYLSIARDYQHPAANWREIEQIGLMLNVNSKHKMASRKRNIEQEIISIYKQ